MYYICEKAKLLKPGIYGFVLTGTLNSSEPKEEIVVSFTRTGLSFAVRRANGGYPSFQALIPRD